MDEVQNVGYKRGAATVLAQLARRGEAVTVRAVAEDMALQLQDFATRGIDQADMNELREAFGLR